MEAVWTVPKVVKYDNLAKPWYVYFRYSSKKFVFKKGINYYKTYKEREKEAHLLSQALHKKLKENWNPNVPELSYGDGRPMNIIEALDFAMEKRGPNISLNTKKHYDITVKFTKTAINSLGFQKLPISDTKRVHIKTIMEKIQKQRKWSNKAYNKNLGYLRAIIGELLEWDVIEFNPASKIKNLKTKKTNANITATDDQSEKIKELLQASWYNFYVYILAIFHTGMRPEEILQIKIGMIDLVNQEINLPPEITKTDIYRIVPINRFLASHLKNIRFEGYPDDYYLFGTLRGDKRNRGITPETDFIPAQDNLHSDTATKLWRKLIKIGLGIDVNMYSMKHLGADKKILAGVDLDALKELYGHTSKLTTLTYAKVVKEVNRKQILEKSPDF